MGLELPGGVRIAAPDPVAQQIIAGLSPMLRAISGQLDILIALECGHMSHQAMRERFLAYEARQRAAENGRGAFEARENGREGESA